MFEIINTLTEDDIKNKYVAIGCYINEDKIPYHSTIVIRYNNEIKHLHFDGKKILYDKIYNESSFHKITDTINVKLLPSFIMMCRRVMKSAQPRYGYFYSGEFYNSNGIHFSEKEIEETMTCSGFVLNILKGFLEEDYIYFDDWDNSPYPTKKYLEDFANYFKLDKNKIINSHRRISPLELLCSGYFSKLPIRKNQIESKLGETSEYLRNY